MKKLLAILLALMLVMVSAFALAADGDPDVDTDTTTEGGTTEGGTTEGGTSGSGTVSYNTGYDATTATGGLGATTAQSINIPKNFSVNSYEGTGVTPAHTLTFTVEEGTVSNATTATSAPPVTIDNLTLAEGATTGNVKINLPVYTAVGVYTYPVTETDTNVAGITYATSLQLKVTVIEDNGLKIAGIALRQAGTKTDKIQNQYEAGSLKVGKTVTGNLGDHSKVWEFAVTFTAPSGDTVLSTISVNTEESTGKVTAEKGEEEAGITSIAPGTSGWDSKTVYVYLTHGQSVEFDNLPAGVTYTVTETQDPNYTMTKSGDEGTIAASLADAEFTNYRNIDVDTGVTLETTAYMLIMALTMAGFAMMVIRRRKEY